MEWGRLRLDSGSLGPNRISSRGVLASLANVTLTKTLRDDDTLLTDGGLALVTFHQGLAVTLKLFTDGSTAVLLTAANFARISHGSTLLKSK